LKGAQKVLAMFVPLAWALEGTAQQVLPGAAQLQQVAQKVAEKLLRRLQLLAEG
jgi:hypothetical protein